MGSSRSPSNERTLASWMMLSAGCHLGVLLGGWGLSALGSLLFPSAPLIDPSQTVEVSMMVLPRSDDPLPDRAQRAPAPKPAPQPISEPEPVPEPPPPEPVKVSDLVVPEPKPQPKPKPKVKTPQERARELIARKEAQRKMLDDLWDAPTGSVDRDATDPNSESDFTLRTLRAGAAGDPEFARYKARVQALFMKHFAPLPSLVAAKPNLECTVEIRVDAASGAVRSSKVVKVSGIPAYDSAALRAAQQVPSIPLPPERYLPLVSAGYQIIFRPQ